MTNRLKIIQNHTLLIGVLLSGISSWLYATGTKIYFYPELFFFPWLVSQGKMPYRDFFDHHGPFMYYVIAPFIKNFSFENLFRIHILNQIILAIVFQFVLYQFLKPSSWQTKFGKVIFCLAGLLFTATIFYFSDNTFWFEHPITTLLLGALAVHLSLTSSIKKNLILGSIIAVATLIKPTAGTFLLVFFLLNKRRLAIFLPTIVIWTILLLWYFVQGGLPSLYNSLFLFNRFVAPLYIADFKSIMEWRFAFLGIVTSFLSIIFWTVSKRKELNILTLCVFASLVFLPPHLPKIHLIPLLTFFELTVFVFLASLKRFNKLIVTGLFLFLTFIMINNDRHMRFISKNTTTPWEEQGPLEIKRFLDKNLKKDQTFFVLGNQSQLYSEFKILPNHYFPVLLPYVSRFDPKTEEKIVSSIKANQPTWVVVPLDDRGKKIDIAFQNFKDLQAFIHNNYQLVSVGEFSEIWKNQKAEMLQ